MEELLKPQDIYSHRAMRTLLTRIAHSSIMRLNPASMDKVCVYVQYVSVEQCMVNLNMYLMIDTIMRR